MNLCKDCKYIGALSGPWPICNHPKAPIDPVFGMKNGSCSLMRSDNCTILSCRPYGDWFESAATTERED